MSATKLASVERVGKHYCIKLEYEGNYKGLYKGTWYRAFTHHQDALVHLSMVNEDLGLMREHFNPVFHKLTQDLTGDVAREIKLNREIKK
jgi:hypothetical protein